MNSFKTRDTQSYSTRNIPADTSSISVSQLNRQVKSLLENSFVSIRVQGELSNFAKPSSGHWYFTLKDTKAQIRCAMFKGNNRNINFSPKEGDAVIVQARVSLYEGRGDYQLICESMEAAGSGRLQLAFEQLKAKLLKEGLFDGRKKKAIPSLIKNLAVITSPTGAAIHDVLSVLKRRFPALPITIYPCQVQGEKAAETIIKAMRLAQTASIHDLILITRGGGSLEDLWPFNEEKLARAISDCNLPTISAVGHEVDFSIADLVADYRAATPSAAAEYLSPDQDNLRVHIDQLQHRLMTSTFQKIQSSKRNHQSISARLRSPQERLALQSLKLENASNRLRDNIVNKLNQQRQKTTILGQSINAHTPRQYIDKRKLLLKHLADSLARNATQNCKSKRQKLQAASAMLSSVCPLSTLERGYSITKNQNGSVITSSKQAQVGQTITNKLSSGVITSTVIKTE